MRGKVSYLDKNKKYGYINIHQQKDGYRFTEKSLIDMPFNELKKGSCVDFSERTIDGKLIANYVRRTPLEWIQGQIIRQEEARRGGPLWRIQSEKGREFWFIEECLCPGEKVIIGDTVRFQCGGYSSNSNGNEAFMVTKKHIGYITFYRDNRQAGQIDFKYNFSLANVNNFEDYQDYFDTQKYFYLVSYNIDKNDASNITIINKTTEILFDQSEKWIDGCVTAKDVTKDSEEYFIIAPKYNSQNTFKTNKNGLNKNCEFKFVEEGQQVSFTIDDSAQPTDIAWLGYITRFPMNTVNPDYSGRINTKVWKDDVEKASQDLLYFKKEKIYNHDKNKEWTKFWLKDVLIGGEKKIIPIITKDSNLRYKVRFAKADDSKHDQRAIRINVIGIAKAPVEDIANSINDKDNLFPEQVSINDKNNPNSKQVIINNYYGDVHQQNNIMLNSTANGFLQSLQTNSLQTYIDTIWQQLKNDDKFIDSSYKAKDDDIANELANKIFPSKSKDVSKSDMDTLEDKFMEAREIHPEISDDMLKKLSNDCTLYIKVAVIVEYELKHLQSLGDFSAQLVMYGKALEQALRDCLYDFIISDVELCDYVDSKGNSFSNISVEKSTIGNYSTLIRENSERLANICELKQKNIAYISKTLQEWEMWWKKLQTDIDNARKIRNQSDHAGTTVQLDELPQMNKLLFSENGIFRSLELISDIEGLTSNAEYFDFYGHHMSGTSLIVGCLSSNRQAALHIKEVKDGFTSPDEFKSLFEKCKNESIKVKIIKESDKGLVLSMKGIKQNI